MKILLTMNLPYFPVYGGANKINRAVAEGLARRGHAVEAVVPALGVPSRVTHAQFLEGLAGQGIEVASDSVADTFSVEGVRVHAVREPSHLRAALVERVARFEPDWILLSSEDPSHNLLDASLGARPGGVVYLVHTVSFLPFGPQAFFPSRGRAKLIGRVAAVVSISQYVAEYMRRWGGLESEVVYWPCYGAGPFPRLGRFDRGYVTMVNPCAVKGISVFTALARAMPEVEFAAVPTWGAVEEDRRALESLPNVRLLEPDTDIDRIFSLTRVLLMPSLWGESFGLTAVEAMLRGIPVLASDVGGLREAKLGTDFLLPVRPVVEFGERLDENMLPVPVVPEQDTGPWRDALRRLLSSHEVYESQSEAARAAAHRFVSTLSLDPLEEILTRLADNPGALRERTAVAARAADGGGEDVRAGGEVGDGGKARGASAAVNANISDGGAPDLLVESPADVMEGLDDLTPEQQSLLMLMLREKASKQAEERPHESQTSDIKPAPRGGKLPLSFAQQRLWFLDQLEPGAATYNIPAAVRLTGALDARALGRAFNEVVRRHEVLRTTFSAADGQPTQEVAPTLTLELPTTDLRRSSEPEREAAVRESAAGEAREPFDLSRGPLLRAKLLRLSDEEHVLLLTMHHIVSDAWSIGVLVGELTAVYEAFAGGRPSPLAELPIQYADYAVWQRAWLRGEALEEQLSYWRRQLAGIPAVLELPTDRPRPPVQSYRGATTPFSLPESTTEELRRLSRAEGVTLFMLLSAAFKALLSRYSSQTDIAVGTPVANRTRTELEGLIGFFVNTLVLRTDLSGDPTFRELVGRVREVCLGAYAHQDVPFERLVEELQPERDLSRPPLFQVMFTLQNAPVPSLEVSGLSLGPVEVETGTSMFDLSLSVEETGRGLVGVFEYSTNLFDAATVERMSAHLGNLLEGVAADACARLSELPLLSEQERRQLIVGWNETAADYPLDKCLHELFEAQAEATPDAVALIFEGERLTYGELNRRANRLAHHLASLGVGPEVVVGFCVERSPEMVIGLLGVMKAGGAYMPLEPEYPKERLAFMMKDAGARVLLTEQKFAGRLPQGAARVVLLDAEREAIARQDERNPSRGVAPENLIYVIYTSGSTGEPKGATLAHRGVCNCLLWLQQTHRLTEADRVLLKAPLSFDASVWELFWPLIVGACAVVARPGGQRDSAYLVELIARRSVTTVHFVPSMFQVFLEEKGVEACGALKRVLCGGEAISPAAVRRFYERLGGELHNFYGPTETSIGSMNRPCDKDADPRTVPIGRPISNTQCYLLDASLRPVPVGVHGEIHTGGVCVARGYVNRADLTAERFIPDPFSAEPGARLYRTGDVARFLPDGNVEFLGRVDHQVKLRGLRIELGEIESALEHHPSVKDAAVLLREDAPGDKRLVAYVVPQRRGATLSSFELRGLLKETLPDFMLPPAFVTLDEMPLTHNVKIDRRALPAPDATHAEGSRPYVAPRTPLEEVVASIWAGVLGRERVGVHDNFFELGGHSLLATQVMSRLRAAFQVDLPLRTLFESPAVAELAQAVGRARSEAHAGAMPELLPAPRDASTPLSFAQQRLWFLDQLVPASPFYNIPMAVRLSGRLDARALGRALSEIVRRHEILRTTFPSIDGEPVQLVAPAGPFELPLVDLSPIPEPGREAEARRLAAEEAREPFDLTRGPLLRAKLLRLSDEEHVLLLTMHHIVSDAWSAGVLVRELTEIYEAFAEGRGSPLAELPIQYADYAVWQRRWLQGEALEEQLSYWRRQLADAPASLELPTDRPRPAVKSHEGRTEFFTLPEELAGELLRLAHREGVTLFMLLSAAFKALLSRYSSQTDITVGTPVANRTRSELEGLIGFFVNTLVLRTDMGGDPTFRELAAREREVCLGAYAHQDVPFERVVEELQPERDLSRPPLFQVMFSLQNESGAGRPETPSGLRLRPLAVEGGTAKFDLTLAVSETGGGQLACALEYDAGLFEEATAKRLAAHWTRLLEGVAADAGARLSELPLLSEGERRQLLNEWGEAGGEGDEGVTGACVHELFERRAAEAPGAVAVVCRGEELTYGELNARANRLARHLRGLGVGHGHRVGVFVERSAEMILALLGVLKAGGAYVPLDTSYPRERLAFMLRDAGAKVLLTQERLAERLPSDEQSVVRLDADWHLIAREDAENAGGATTDESVAYVIYTSGSTGQPKGSVIPHRAITRLVCSPNYVGLDAADIVAQASNASFDAATFEVWGALLNGARLVILERDVILSPSEFASELRDRGVTVLFLTTALFNLLAREAPWGFGSLRHLLFGGEAVDPARVGEVLKAARPGRLLHVYGPTECTTFASFHAVREVAEGAHTIPIGRPISKTQTYILDGNLLPAPVGVHGELYVGGCGLAQGYLNRADLTAERFIPHPFSPEPGARLYRTGDVARWRVDGEMEFVGRVDNQIKLRGFRVELEEVEAALLADARVRECAVTLREDAPGEKRLVAYVVSEGGATSAELRDRLRRRLPDFMIPAAFVRLEALPLTPNGKIDRRALPAPDETAAHGGDSFVAPRDTVELQLSRVWEELLGVGRVGVRDNFFDLGGHSLLAVRLMSQVRKRFGRDLPLAALFECATVENLAALIRREGAFSPSPLVAVQPEGERPPFFCVHPAGGNVICYAALARALGRAQPFYALQARGLDGRDEPLTSLEEMAAYYVEAVRGARPEGPYLLGGWSLGGAVAFEMARQLREGGQEVALLALLDSPAPPASERGLEIDEVELLAGLAEDLGLRVSAEELRGMEPDERLSFFLEQGRARQAVPADYDLTQARRLLRVYKTNVRALRNYEPRPTPTRITLLRAEETPAADSVGAPNPFASDPTLGWGAISTVPVEVRRVPGDHVSMLSEAHVGALAVELGRFIEETSAARTGPA